MAITWANILNWESGSLESIAKDLLEASQGLREAYEDGEDALSAVQSEGEAVTAMRATTTKNLTSLERALTNVNGALMAIEGARDGVATVVANVHSLLAYASAVECTILTNGTVIDQSSSRPVDTPSPGYLDVVDKIKEIVEQANQVDRNLCEALSNINNDRYTDGDGADNKVVGVPDFPQPNWTPSQNAAWWKSLSYEQQQFLINRRPDDIRHLDGLPAVARDKANHHALHGYLHADGKYRQGALKDAEEEAIEAQKEFDKAPLDGKRHLAKERLDRATEALEDLIAIDSQTDNMTRRRKGLPPAYLLDFDYDKKYQRTTAIVSSGNPDTATHVSTLVPGIGTNVRGDLGYYMEFNERLRKQTAYAGIDPNNVATISYLGYVAPKNSIPDGGIIQASDIGYANRAAPKLAQFEEGLRASAEANNHNFVNTLIGHSYGSTTSGKSMTLVAPGTVDRFIMCGSPGSGVQSIDEYNVPKEHVYVSSIPTHDSVQDLNLLASSGYGKDPRNLDGITHLSGDATDSADYWVNKKIPGISRWWTDVTHSFEHHMDYFDEGTRTSQDFANIVAGTDQTTDEEWEMLDKAHELGLTENWSVSRNQA